MRTEIDFRSMDQWRNEQNLREAQYENNLILYYNTRLLLSYVFNKNKRKHKIGDGWMGIVVLEYIGCLLYYVSSFSTHLTY